MITLNVKSRSYHAARKKLEKTQLQFRIAVFPNDDVGEATYGEHFSLLSDLEEYIDNVNGGFCHEL